MDAYGWSYRDVMDMPFRTLMAFDRHAHITRINKRNREAFGLS